jgi:DNA invertase Pin-like site-specific DNA recombinase
MGSMNRTVIYLRVSSANQTEESQLSPCKKFCEERNYDIIDVYKDHAKSAYKNVIRPSYDKVNELVKQRKIDHIVVWALDRWTRRGAKELQNTIDYLSAYNVQLHSVQESWLESINMPGGIGNVIRDFFIGLIGWMSKQESDLKSERILASKKFQKAKDKGLVGRDALSKETTNEVTKLLSEGVSYRKIHNLVTYKLKFGKVKHVSIGTISSIAKNLRSNSVIKNSCKENPKNRHNSKRKIFEQEKP